KASSDIFKDIPKFSDDDDSGSDDTGTQPPDGGITDHGLLSGLNDPADHPWALQTDFSNVDDWTPADNRFLNESANLSDLASISTARGNLDVFSKGQSDNRYLQIANNLSEITLITGNKTFDSPINLSNNSPIKASGDNAIEFDAQGNVTFPEDVSILGSTFSADVQRFSTDDSIIKFADGNITDAVDIGFIGQRASMNAGVIWDESRDEIAGVLTNDDPDLQTTITIDQYADLHGKDMLSAGDSYADNFSLVTDFNGVGWEGTHEGDFNVRNLVVRQSARFRELIIDQLSAIGGSTIL